MVLRAPCLQVGQDIISEFSLWIVLSTVIPFRIWAPIPISFALNSFKMSVINLFALSRICFSFSSRFVVADLIASISSSIERVRFSSIIIGEYFSRDSISFIPSFVACIDRPSRYPLSNSVSTIEDLVAFVPRFFLSRIVINEVGVNLFGAWVSFSGKSMLSILTGPFSVGQASSFSVEG